MNEMPKQENIKQIPVPTPEALLSKAGENLKAQETARKAKMLDEKTSKIMSMLAGSRKKPELASPSKPPEKSDDYWSGVNAKRPSSQNLQ